MNSKFLNEGILPKIETQTMDFLKENPKWNGKDVIVGVFDTGVGLGVEGLEKTVDGKVKIIDIVDTTGSGDVKTSKVVEASEDGKLALLSGRTIEIPKKWKNSTKKYRIGTKRTFDFYPSTLQKRIAKDEKFNSKNEQIIANLNQNKTLDQDEKENQIKQLNELMKIHENNGSALDVIIFKEDESEVYKVAVLTSEEDIENVKLLSDYSVNHEYSSINNEINFGVKIYEDGDLVSIVAPGGSHGTHVSGMIGAFYENNEELNGMAPNCQIVNIKIGDSRLGTMETGTGLIRGLQAAKINKCDIINMSYGEIASLSNHGKFIDLIDELVNEQGVIFVASAGNNGPCISTVGTPGGTTSSCIGVGAYVNQNMMESIYSIRNDELPDETQFVWSSRGPAMDGDLGVNISCPGGAVAPIPKYLNAKNTLMNGTSMSSPHCAGNIALLVSALKDKGEKYTPFSILRAIENTAKQFKNPNFLTHGRGLFQVQSALDYLLKYPLNKESEEPVFYSISTEKKGKGIYLYNYEETHQSTFEETVTIQSIFKKKTPKEDLVKFEKRFQLKLKDENENSKLIKFPSYMFLSNVGPKGISVKIDTTKFKENSIYYNEILGFDSDSEENQGPLFRIPITILKPLTIESNLHYQNVSFTSGHLERNFIFVPNGCYGCRVKVQGVSVETKKLFALQEIQLIPNIAFTKTSSEKWFRLNQDQEFVHEFEVFPERTLEVTIGQNWASLGTATLSYEIEFFGIKSFGSGGGTIHLNGSERVLQLPIQTVWQNENLNLSLNLTQHHQEISPSNSEIKTYSDERNLLVDGKSVHQLELTYSFNLTETSQITLRPYALSDLLYESCYHSQLFLVFDSNKQLVKVQDYHPKKFKLNKGKYTVKLQIRHDELKMLKRLINLIIVLEIQLTKPIPLDFYSTMNDALSEESKLTSYNLKKGELKMIFIKALRRKNLPKGVKSGEILSGNISFFKNKNQKINFTFSVPIEKPKPKLIKKDKELSAIEKYENDLLKYQIDTLSKITKKEDFNEVYSLILNEKNENSLSFLFLKLKFLQDEEALVLSNKILDLIDKDKLAIYFGLIQKEKNEEMEKNKKILIDTLTFQGKYFLKIENLEKLNQINDELSKWTKEQNLEFQCFSLVKSKKYAEAMKLIITSFAVKKEKVLYDLLKQITKENEWNVCGF
eukprot:gene2483-3192_t